jgi:hypothetical protein
MLAACCSALPRPKIDEIEMQEILRAYTVQASEFCNRNSEARWASQTDLNNESLQQAAVGNFSNLCVIIAHREYYTHCYRISSWMAYLSSASGII